MHGYDRAELTERKRMASGPGSWWPVYVDSLLK